MSSVLGLDLGTNSIGWCLIDEKNQMILGTGVRIFSDGREPKSKTSLAVARREARAQSRRRDRYKRRRKALVRTLVDYGLMPKGKKERDQLVRQINDKKDQSTPQSVYGLRARALDEKLLPYEIGRCLFHLNQRRGFKSNRKTDGRDNEAGKIKIAQGRLQQEMIAAGARTLGEYLFKRREDGSAVRTRLRPETGEDAKGDGYDFYADRSDLLHEFETIWDKQASHHPDLMTDARKKHLHDIIFYQCPLKPPLIGKCTHNPSETRLAKAHPLFQEFRVYKEVNELEIVDGQQTKRKLSLDERNALISKLKSTRKASFKTLRKTLKLGPEHRFRKESESRIDLLGNEVYAALANKKCFGPRWAAFGEERQWEIVQKLRNEENPKELHEWLIEECDLDDDAANAVASAPLPEGYGRTGETYLRSVLDELKASVIPESKAAENCGYNHSDKRDRNDPGLDELPKYQTVLERQIPPGIGGEEVEEKDPRWDIVKGRITNPTVHIALNQLRRVVNAIIKKYGKPQRITIELARDLKLSDKQKEEVNKTIAKNTRDAERRSELLRETYKVTDNGRNRAILKLWEELSEDQMYRYCIYSGKVISPTMLFNGEVDIDHILPFSQTLDDSNANKILCTREANRQKKNRVPADVIEWQDHYSEILARAMRLPKNKQWRFGADAMERFRDESGFLARQLTDTQYLSRLAREYLECLYPAEEADQFGELRPRKHVNVTPGKLTETLRRKWGLNSILDNPEHLDASKEKNRMDHRHHAIDAAVVAVTSVSMLQTVSQLAARHEAGELNKMIDGEKLLPWPTFRSDLERVIKNIVVSHKPDHGTVSREGYAAGKGKTAGKLHNDTAYGMTGETDDKGKHLVVRSKAITDLKKPADIMAIRDKELRDCLWTATRDLSGKEFEAAVIKFSETNEKFGRKKDHDGKTIRHPLNRVRMLEPLAVIPIKDRSGKLYKGYKGDANYRYDVWQLPNGKWKAEVVSMFDAHQPGWQSDIKRQYPAAKKMLRLQQNDCVVVEDEAGEQAILRVVKFNNAGQIYFAGHNEAGSLKARDSDKGDPFKYLSKSGDGLRKMSARQIRVDEIGQVFDPGPRS